MNLEAFVGQGSGPESGSVGSYFECANSAPEPDRGFRRAACDRVCFPEDHLPSLATADMGPKRLARVLRQQHEPPGAQEFPSKFAESLPGASTVKLPA